MTAPQPRTTYALCFCTDGQHAEPDRESFRSDRAAVEEGVRYADQDMPLVHEVACVEVVTEVPFVDVRHAAYRDEVVRMIEADHAARMHVAELERAAKDVA